MNSCLLMGIGEYLPNPMGIENSWPTPAGIVVRSGGNMELAGGLGFALHFPTPPLPHIGLVSSLPPPPPPPPTTLQHTKYQSLPHPRLTMLHRLNAPLPSSPPRQAFRLSTTIIFTPHPTTENTKLLHVLEVLFINI